MWPDSVVIQKSFTWLTVYLCVLVRVCCEEELVSEVTDNILLFMLMGKTLPLIVT